MLVETNTKKNQYNMEGLSIVHEALGLSERNSSV